MGAFRDMLAAVDSHCIGLLSGPDVAVYHAGDGVAASVSGIFDAAFQHADAGFAGTPASNPTFFCRESELCSDPRCDVGAWLEINGLHYTIREAQPDNQGGMLFSLHFEVCDA